MDGGRQRRESAVSPQCALGLAQHLRDAFPVVARHLVQPLNALADFVRCEVGALQILDERDDGLLKRFLAPDAPIPRPRVSRGDTQRTDSRETCRRQAAEEPISLGQPTS